MRDSTLQYFVIAALILAAQMVKAESSISFQVLREATYEHTAKRKSLSENYATDNRLADYVKDRIVLPNGLIVRRWRWTSTAKALGLDKYPNFGLLSQDVQALYPDMVFENDSGYLVFDRQKLVVKDKFVRELSSICGVLYGCSKYRQHLLLTKKK